MRPQKSWVEGGSSRGSGPEKEKNPKKRKDENRR
jgi:hypothetical protein